MYSSFIFSFFFCWEVCTSDEIADLIYVLGHWLQSLIYCAKVQPLIKYEFIFTADQDFLLHFWEQLNTWNIISQNIITISWVLQNLTLAITVAL